MDRKSFLIRSGKAIMGAAFMSSPHDITGGKMPDSLTLFLSGDVMTGRGIDQVLPHSVDPRIHETYTKNAKRYVQLAERAGGQLPDEVSYRYIWGDALEVLQEQDPDFRIINLETSVTTSDEYWEGKGIHYRMHPENTPLLTEADIDICVLGNNHMLDWGYDGLVETVNVLQEAGLKTAGAGRDSKSAATPAVADAGSGRLLVFSYATPTAGAPVTWRAREDRPGVNLLPEISRRGAEKVIAEIRHYRQEGDRVVLSIHWGGNWGYDIPKAQREFAHRLVDSGMADVIHGHSSHHPKGIEVYNGRPVFYSCGDLINDYEGIGRHEQYRGDLSLMYFPELNEAGELVSLKMAPMQIQRFRLRRAPPEAAKWLRDILDRECGKFGHSVESSDGRLVLRLNNH